MQFVLIILVSFIPLFSFCQSLKIISGPVNGHRTDSSQLVWFLLKKEKLATGSPYSIDSLLAETVHRLSENPQNKIIAYRHTDPHQFSPYISLIVEYAHPPNTAVRDDFTFLTGSCAYPYPEYPVKTQRRYGIFEHMSDLNADFMIWLGDNVYYQGSEWDSPEGMFRKYLYMRTLEPLRTFLKTTPQYAIWDDHDYGPNDSGTDFWNKSGSLETFKSFWPNPSFGTDSIPGIFTSFSYQDADFFMLDVRYHRGSSGKLLGQEQMDWLKAKLRSSSAPFKFIISGSQVLVRNRIGEGWGKFPEDRAELLDFIKAEKINGVIFLSGDRHYTEMSKLERANDYPIHEFTCSPLTSFLNPLFKLRRPVRVRGSLFRKHNFGRIQITGPAENRVCIFEVYRKDGKMVWQYSIPQSEIQ